MYLEKEEYGQDVDGNRGTIMTTPIIEYYDRQDIISQIEECIKDNGSVSRIFEVTLWDMEDDEPYQIEVDVSDYVSDEHIEALIKEYDD